jgi:hypothetical protein
VIALGHVRPVLALEQVQSEQAVVEELCERQACERLDLLVGVLFQDGAQEGLVALMEAENDLLADRAERVARDVVALQDGQGLMPRTVFAPGGKAVEFTAATV